MTDATSDSTADVVDSEGHRTAVLVIHGIGQQQPLQALDAFVRGLRDALKNERRAISLTHFRQSREKLFDHFVRLQVTGECEPEQVVQDLDVYEFYWAPLTQGKATFWQVMSWFRTTVLTPFKRFAYNLPLTLEQQRDTPVNWRFFQELWRAIWIPLIGLLIVAFASYFVSGLPTLSNELAKALTDSYSKSGLLEISKLRDLIAAAVFVGAAIASLAIVCSFPEQLRDLSRLRRIEPGFPSLIKKGVQNAYDTIDGNWPSRAFRSLAGIWQGFQESRTWQAEVKVRRQFFFLSIVALLGFAGLIWIILKSQTPFSLFITNSLQNIAERNWVKLVLIGASVGAGYSIKKVFVDFLGDIALYVTADETSAFFRTRSEILDLATKKARWLLTNSEYSTVVVAGHSLGSVIAYDTISRLRLEVNLPAATTEKKPLSMEEFQRLKLLVTFGSPLDKVLYFFRQRIKPYETVRGHILNELHGFRRHPDLLTHDRSIRDHGQAPSDGNIYWLNCYSRMDPVSARLDFYTNVHNIHRWYPGWGFAHTSYWHDGRFYAEVLNALLKIADAPRTLSPNGGDKAVIGNAPPRVLPKPSDQPLDGPRTMDIDRLKPISENILEVSKWLAGLTTGAVGWLVINARPSKLFCPESLGENPIKECLHAFSGNNVYSMIFWPTMPDWLITIQGLTQSEILQGSWNLRVFVLSLLGFLLSLLCSILLRSQLPPAVRGQLNLFFSQLLLVAFGGLCVLGLALGSTEAQEQLTLKVDWGRPPKIEMAAELKPLILDPQSIERVEKARLGINEKDIMALKEIALSVKKPEFELEMKKGQTINLDPKNSQIIATGSVTLAQGQTVGIDTKNSQLKVSGLVSVDPTKNKVEIDTNKNQVTAAGTVTIASGQTIGLETNGLGGIERELKVINKSVQGLDPDLRSRGQRDAR